MIVGSLLLIVVAVGLLVVGLMQGSDPLLVASIGASLLAAVALIVGGRQAAAARTSRGPAVRTGRQVRDDDFDPLAEPLGASLGASRDVESELRTPVGAGARSGGGGTTYGRGVGGGRTDAEPIDETAMTAPVRDEPAVPHQSFDDYPAAGQAPAGRDWSAVDDDDDDYDDEDPEDEPAIQQSSAADLARVAAMDTDVLVIDGRPRYHVRGCVTLLGRDNEPLPVGEAVELGFTPCASCAPNDAVLAGRA